VKATLIHATKVLIKHDSLDCEAVLEIKV
jgi:hypothetical protein